MAAAGYMTPRVRELLYADMMGQRYGQPPSYEWTAYDEVAMEAALEIERWQS